MWAVSINSGLSKSLSNKYSKHFNIISVRDYSEHESFYFSSPHIYNIDVNDPSTAFFRAKALIRLMNGILMLNDQPQVTFDSTRIAYMESFDVGHFHSIKNSSQLEYKELQNPFQTDLSQAHSYNEGQLESSNFNNYVVDLFDMAYTEELVKEVLILFCLSKLEPLYFLMNTSKIIETVEFDLGLLVKKKENGEKRSNSEVVKEKKKILGEVFEILGEHGAKFSNAYNFFKVSGDNSFQRFINTRDGSGIFSRHGANDKTYENKNGDKLPMISFEDIEHNTQVLIYEWINYKLIKSKGYRYPPNKKGGRVVDIKDDFFDFDL